MLVLAHLLALAEDQRFQQDDCLLFEFSLWNLSRFSFNVFLDQLSFSTRPMETSVCLQHKCAKARDSENTLKGWGDHDYDREQI